MKKVLSAIIIAIFSGSLVFFCVSNNGRIDIGEKVSASEEIEVSSSDDDWKNNHPKVKGIYVTGPTAGIDKMDDIIQLINDTELNTIVLDVKDDSGNVTFRMDNPEVEATDACIPYIGDINALLSKLKDNNIYVIARVPCFKDPVLASSKPYLCLRDDTGAPVTDASGNAWVNPCNEEVWNYVISIVDSCCALGFDEIQLDYVRFPVGQNSEQAVYGVPADDDSRQEYINNFLKRVSETTDKYQVPLTADVFGTIIRSTEDANHVGQNYETLAESLDVLCPMIYPSHYASGEFGIESPDVEPYKTILSALEGSKEKLSGIPEEDCAVIRPWLQAFTASWLDNYIEYDETAIRDQIQAVYDAGYEEWILWNSKSNYVPF